MGYDSISIALLQNLLIETDIHRILEIIAQHVDQSVQGGARGVVLLYDPVKNCLIPGSRPDVLFSPKNPDRENIVPVKAMGTTSVRAAYYKIPILTLNADLDPGWNENRDLAHALNLKSAYATPILSSKNELLGIFAAHYDHYLQAEPPETNLYRTLAGLAAVALEKHQEQIKKMQMLSELRISKERLRLALESQKMGVWDWLLDLNQLHWDENMFEVFGLQPTDFDGTFQSFLKRVYPEDLNSVKKVLDDVFIKDLPFDFQFRITRNGEVRHLAAIGTLKRNNFGTPVRMTGLNWDITEKVLAARKLEQERARSISSSKMASLGEMASGIAHEINNPLTIILNRAGSLKDQLLADRFEKTQALEELVRIENTVERIAKIIRGLRAFSRNGENDPMISCELKPIVDESLELCQERFNSYGVSLRIKELQKILSIQCRPSQISQVLLNILNNSFDAIIGSENPWIEMACTTTRENVQIRITDSGKGIAETIAEKIMDPFFTTKEIGKGTGLGLSISKGIIEEHGGRLYLDREAANTSFVIELPVEEILGAATEIFQRVEYFPGA